MTPCRSSNCTRDFLLPFRRKKNPRYAFSEPLRELLKSALRAYPDSVVNELTMPRTRPRKTGKPEIYLRR